MEETRQAIEGLTRLGLPLGEAKTYVALLTQGPSEATPLAKSADVPQPKIYSYLANLESKSIVTKLEVEGKPNIYNPTEFDVVVEVLREELNNNLSKTEKALKSLSLRDKSEEPVAYVAISRGEKAVLNALNNSLEKIETNAILICGSYYDDILEDFIRENPEKELIRPIKRIQDNIGSFPPPIQEFLKLFSPLTEFRPLGIVRNFDINGSSCESVVISSRPKDDPDESILLEINHPAITKLQLSLILTIMESINNLSLLE